MNDKTHKHDTERAAIVAKVAQIHGVSERYVRMVINEDRKNEAIINSYMTLLESFRDTENLLLKAVQQAIPFN